MDPSLFAGQVELVRDHFPSIVRRMGTLLADTKGLNLRWNDGSETVLAEVGRRLGLENKG
jgi:hypothetical protein